MTLLYLALGLTCFAALFALTEGVARTEPAAHDDEVS